MSSRNAYLGVDDRRAALALSRGLGAAETLFRTGERDAVKLVAAARSVLDGEPRARIDYIELRDADELTEVTRVSAPAVLAVAAFVGATRLIDNRVLR
jgi:pantoate--beta-alanine ligase